MNEPLLWEYRVLRYPAPYGWLYALHKVWFRNGRAVESMREPMSMVGEDLYETFASYYTAMKKPWLDCRTLEEVPTEPIKKTLGLRPAAFQEEAHA